MSKGFEPDLELIRANLREIERRVCAEAVADHGGFDVAAVTRNHLDQDGRGPISITLYLEIPGLPDFKFGFGMSVDPVAIQCEGYVDQFVHRARRLYEAEAPKLVAIISAHVRRGVHLAGVKPKAAGWGVGTAPLFAVAAAADREIAAIRARQSAMLQPSSN
jgi:hypothetical protein